MTNVTLFDTGAIIPQMSRDEAERCISNIRDHLGAARREAKRLYEGEGWRALGYDSFADCMYDRLGYSKRYSYLLLDAAEVEQNIGDQLITGSVVPESQLRPLSRLEPQQQREAWRIANKTAPDGKLTASHVKQTVHEYKSQVVIDTPRAFNEQRKAEQELLSKPRQYAGPEFITLEHWNNLNQSNQQRFLQQVGTSQFNSTNDNVEWAMWTWNPVTGCLHGCEYCYARDIAARFYSYLGDEGERFKPVLYPDRLTAPANTKQPNLDAIESPVARLGKRNVFVCSMADLFGKWVPNEWIEAVLQQAWDNPQWNFLFLTKFPVRMAEFEYPDNAWIGTTVDKQWAVERAEKAFTKIRNSGYNGVAWLSCEPMMEKLTFSSLEMFNWVVMGGSSRSTQTPEFKPDVRWWVSLLNQADKYSIPVYQKTNLGVDNEKRIREYPVSLEGGE